MYGIEVRDPIIATVAIVIIAEVSIAAVSVPAWRAMRVDPISALRHE